MVVLIRWDPFTPFIRLKHYKQQNWDTVIEPRRNLFRLDLQEIWNYRDLIFLFVRRDFVAVYKQTILGPLWHVVQPLLTTITFAVIFGKVAGLAPEGIPALLFYMSGIVTWSYFANTVNKTSKTFVGNANLFGKVYFPRLVMPISVAVSNLIAFGIQMATFLFFLAYYSIFDSEFHFILRWELLLFPFLIVIMALLGLAFGIIVSSLTTKYRDLSFLVGFGIQLLMYGSPIIFPLTLPQLQDSPKILSAIKLNPMTSVIETARVAFFGGQVDWSNLVYTVLFTLFTLLFSVMLFNRIEKTFTDTI